MRRTQLLQEGPMSEIVFLVEDAPEGGLTARALGESIFVQAEDLDDLREQFRFSGSARRTADGAVPS